MEKRKDYLDVLSVLACFLVLWDHVDAMFHSYSTGRTWLLSAIIHVAVNPAVPIFVMISGATLLGYRERYSTVEFFKRRILKVFIPFLFWSVFYMLFFWIADGKSVASIREGINGIIYNNAYNGLFWFFYPLFGLYLAMPIFAAVDEQQKEGIYRYGILGYLLLGGLVPILLKLIGLKINGGFTMQVISQFLFYALFGYYIDHYEIRKSTRILIYSVGLAAFIYNVLHVMIVSTEKGAIASDYTTYTYTLTAASLYTAIRYFPEKLISKAVKAVRPVRDVTFGIYLVQRFVLFYARKTVYVRSPWYITLGIIPMFAICVIICKAIKRCPVLKHLI